MSSTDAGQADYETDGQLSSSLASAYLGAYTCKIALRESYKMFRSTFDLHKDGIQKHR
jgi:hypothetical protein